MSYKIKPFDRIVVCPPVVVVILVVLILVCYSLFLSTSFMSVGKALQEPVVITTEKVNPVSSKVTSANTGHYAVCECECPFNEGYISIP